MNTKITLLSGNEHIVLESIQEILELSNLGAPSFELSIQGDGKITVMKGAIVSLQNA